MAGSCVQISLYISVVFTQQSILVYNSIDFISFLVTFIVFSPLTFLYALEAPTKVNHSSYPPPLSSTNENHSLMTTQSVT